MGGERKVVSKESAAQLKREEALKAAKLKKSQDALKRAVGYVTTAITAGANKQLGTTVLAGLAALGEVINSTGLVDIPYGLLGAIVGVGAIGDIVQAGSKEGALDESINAIKGALQNIYHRFFKPRAPVDFKFDGVDFKSKGLDYYYYGGDTPMLDWDIALGKRNRRRDSYGHSIFDKFKKAKE
jgi:hypothetical protein